MQLAPKSKYKQRFKEQVKAIDSRVYYAYINDATKQNDPVISTHSDCFHGALKHGGCLLYTSPSPRDGLLSRMPSSA